jgi:hypothetical protein
MEKLRQHESKFQLQRFMLAAMALLLAIGGIVFYMFPEISDGGSQFIGGVLLKISMVLALAWVASPQLERLGWQRIRGSMLIGIVIVVILYALRPRIGAIAALMLIGLTSGAAIISWIRKLTKN